MIDFQEAVEEVVSGFIHTAYAEVEGKLWKMKLNKYNRVAFYLSIDNVWFVLPPNPSLYLTKWQPVRVNK